MIIILILIFCLLLVNSTQLLPNNSITPTHPYLLCPYFKFGENGPRIKRKFIAVAKYGRLSSQTFLQTNWTRLRMMVDYKIGDTGSRAFTSYEAVDRQDNLIYSACNIYHNHSVFSWCEGVVVVLHKEGLLQAQCKSWVSNPSVTFSVDANFKETFRNYTHLLKTMLDTYAKGYNLTVEDFTPLHDEGTIQKIVVYFLWGGVIVLSCVYCCYVCFKFWFEK